MKFRYNASIALAGLLAFLGAVPLATSGFGDRSHPHPWYAYPLLLIMLVPIGAMIWGWRAGTDADAEGLWVRPYGFGGQAIAWTEIVGIGPQGRKVYAALSDEQAVPLPAVTRADIPRLVSASGQKINSDEAARTPEPADQ